LSLAAASFQQSLPSSRPPSALATVKGNLAGHCEPLMASVSPALPTAVRSVVKRASQSDWSAWTTLPEPGVVGMQSGISTVSMTWTTPLRARTSAFTTPAVEGPDTNVTDPPATLLTTSGVEPLSPSVLMGCPLMSAAARGHVPPQETTCDRMRPLRRSG